MIVNLAMHDLDATPIAYDRRISKGAPRTMGWTI